MSMPTTISTMLDHQPLHYYLFIISSQPIHHCLQPLHYYLWIMSNICQLQITKEIKYHLHNYVQ